MYFLRKKKTKMLAKLVFQSDTNYIICNNVTIDNNCFFFYNNPNIFDFESPLAARYQNSKSSRSSGTYNREILDPDNEVRLSCDRRAHSISAIMATYQFRFGLD